MSSLPAPAYEKFLILGLDSLNWTALRPLLDDGIMPNLRRLAEKGCQGVLRSTLPPTTPPAWTSFMTGVHPGVHGIVGFKSFDPTTNTYHLLKTRNLGPRSFYSRLSQAGRRVGVAMQPNTHPPFPLNGFVITGFDSPGTRAEFASPREMERELLELCPDHERNYNLKTDWEEDGGTDDAAFGRNIERLCEAVRRQTALYLQLLRRYELDVFMAYFQAPDVLFHHAWGWCDPATAGASPARRRLVEHFFRELDEGCGRLLEAWPERGRLTLVLSDHGHQHRAVNVHMNTVLRELGFLRPSGTLTRLRNTITGRTARMHDRGLGAAIDWRRTQAFMPMGEQSAFIYVNLEGRQPFGSVPREDYPLVRDRVIAALRAYRRPDSGAPAFGEVYSGDEVFERKDRYMLPDIVVNPPPSAQFKRKLRDGPTFTPRKDPFTGNHHPDGIYLWQGAGIRRGSGEPHSIVDLAPTILAALGVAVPAYMQGRPMHSCFEQALRVEPLAVQWDEDTQPAPSYSAAEEALLEERLQDLGYVD